MKKTLWIALVIFGVSCSTQNNVDIDDYPIVTSVHDLAQEYDLRIDKSGKSETAVITTFIDGSAELDYEYEKLDSDQFMPLFYSITVEKEVSVKDAEAIYKLGLNTMDMAETIYDQGVIEIDSIELPGDEAFYALRTVDGEMNGMFFTVRSGKNVYTLMMSGLYSTDHSILNYLIIPRIKYLENFNIKKKE